MKRVFVANLQEGARIEDVFLVVSRSVGTTKNGSPFLKIRLADKTGEVDAVKWDASESEISRLREDEYVLVHGSVRSYNDNPQLSVDSFKRFTEPIDPSHFIKSSPKDPEAMMAEFLSLLGQVSDPHIKRLLDNLFGDTAFAARFRQAPAAARVHHAYVAGLLEHTLNVVKNCIAIAGLYPQAHKDLLIAGAALHDIGKVDEFVWSGTIRYSEMGNMVGHIVKGAMIVKDIADAIEGFDPMLNLALQHMILSHHGQYAYGSPKLPMSIEAMLLHHADDMDAQVAIIETAIEESDGNGDSGSFTKRHYLLDRPLFKGFAKAGSGSEEAHSGNGEDGVDLDLFAVDPFLD